MRIEIHDVDHGACALITGPRGHRLMIDCGLSLEREWFPSITHHGERIDTLVLLNLDDDHCEDLVHIWNNCPLGAIVSNPTVDARALAALKAQRGMSDGVGRAAAIFEHFGGTLLGDWQNDLGGVSWHAFWNRYALDFRDTNNLSLALFVTFNGFTILFGGDLECAGWQKLLEIDDFRRRLASTHVYVASHHGRDNGRCEDLLRLCRPELVIFSDGRKQYATQETTDWYAHRTTGIPDYSKPKGVFGQPQRKVMTTRRDGTIIIDVADTGHYLVTPTKGSPVNAALANALAAAKPRPLFALAGR